METKAATLKAIDELLAGLDNAAAVADGRYNREVAAGANGGRTEWHAANYALGARDAYRHAADLLRGLGRRVEVLK